MKIGKYTIDIPSVLTGLALTVIHVLLFLGSYTIIGDTWSGYSGLENSSWLLFPFYIALLFSPFVLYVKEMKLVFRYDWAKALKIFFVAELWTIIVSYIFISIVGSSNTFPIPGLILVVLSFASTIFYVSAQLHKESPQQLFVEKWKRYLLLLSSGSAMYIAVAWTFFFVPIVSSFRYSFYGFSFDSFSDGRSFLIFIIQLLLYLLVLFALASPYIISYEYVKLLSSLEFSFVKKLPGYGKSIALASISLIAVYVAMLLGNGSFYTQGVNPQLRLADQASYEALYKMDGAQLTDLFVETYRREHTYFFDKNVKIGTELFCNGNTTTKNCSVIDSLAHVVFNPFIYQTDFLLPNRTSDATRILRKLYEMQIPKDFPLEGLNNALSDIGYGNTSGSSTVESDNSTTIKQQEGTKTVSMSKFLVETTVYPLSGIQKNDVTFAFSTQSRTSQEAQLLLTLPPGSVVTELLLGRDLEMSALVAPKGAANAVYEQSVVRRTDPAVLRKISANTYTLKVFPVFAANAVLPPRILNEVNPTSDAERSLQKVKITYYSPVTERVVLPVVKNLRNTSISANSVIGGVVTVVGEADVKGVSDSVTIKDEPVVGADAKISWASAYYSSYMEVPNVVVLSKKITPYCSEQKQFSQNAEVFIDASYSAKEWKQEYSKVLSVLAEKYGTLKIVTYNNSLGKETLVEDKASAEAFVTSLPFWGYSSGKVQQEIAKNLEDSIDAYVLTDGDFFAMDGKLVEDQNYSQGKAILSVVYMDSSKEIRPELGSILAKNGGSELFVDDIDGYLNGQCIIASKSNLSFTEATAIAAFSHSRENEKLLSEITDATSFEKIGRKMFKNAGMYHFVDFMNSFIAVETELQKQQLMEETAKETAFDVTPQVQQSRGSANWGPMLNSTSSSNFFGGSLGGEVSDLPMDDLKGAPVSPNSQKSDGAIVVILLMVTSVVIYLFVKKKDKSTSKVTPE